jgi:hypothetical protein
MSNIFIVTLTDFHDYIMDIAVEAIKLYKIRIANYEIDIPALLSEWIDHVYIQIFGEDYTPTFFDRKVEMLFGWFNSATEEDVEIYFDHDYYYFANILDSMFPNNVGLK